MCVLAGWRVGLTCGVATGVLGGVGVNSSNSPGSAHGREFPGPPNSFFSRNRKNKYISIFSTVSRDSTRDTIRRGRTHGSQSDDTPSPPGGGSAAFGGEAALTRSDESKKKHNRLAELNNKEIIKKLSDSEKSEQQELRLILPTIGSTMAREKE